MEKISAKKSLGQNFLNNKAIAEKIVAQLGDISNCPIVEIGPGMGVLTEIILKKNSNLTLVEIDPRAIAYLSEMFAKQIGNGLSIINLDVLKFDVKAFAEQNGGKISVIGNIPYNISTEIFFLLFENAKYIEKAVLTVQKEVARRIAAKPKTKDYGVTTVARAMTSEAKIAFDIAPGSFNPPPKIVSSVLVFDFKDNPEKEEKYFAMMKLVRAAFSTRRKMLRNALQTYLSSRKIETAKFEEYCDERNIKFLRQRAEELDLKDFENLYLTIEDYMSSNA